MTAGAGVDIIARQRALMPDIECAVGVERQRMGGEHRAVGDQFSDFGFDLAVMHGFYPNSGPATANGSTSACAVAPPNRMR